ncbi:DNA primase family protein [Mesorhizobium australicum]|uniref:Putative DNA primase/helicase n=1 Tax=Mesorhizobium australicum TaxID=536018 RepID=A0A1X7P0U5_9HYPH|nr:phage/plasmid primase, P4 family [Mesorhizobium australicum]SMH43485.1 putative DNA primase/helicase [Mesorhizobium australicum]
MLEGDTETETEAGEAYAPLFAINAKQRARLFTEANLKLITRLRVSDLAGYMRLIGRLEANGVKRLRDLEIEIDRRVKKLEKEARSRMAGEVEQATPLTIARRFREEVHPTLLWYQADWLLHRGSHYDVVEPDAVRRDVYAFLEDIGAMPNSRTVGETIDALKGISLVERGTYAPPCWLNGDERARDYPASEILACRNGLLHLPTGTLLDPSSAFFTRSGLPYDYDPDAPLPAVWLQFLADVWGDDPDQIALLQEIMGLLLTPDTSKQKFFLLLGPTRSGKGTIVRTISRLLGPTSVCSPSLVKLGDRFGLEATLGKTLATVSDMRLGKQSDRQEIVGNILRIVGEDDVDVERKHVGGAITTKLNIRILIATNLLPPLPDVSGAVAARLVALKMTKSFLGVEDETLSRKLEAELPGILNWAIEGWRRLQAQGRFTSTAASREISGRMAELASPLTTFVAECCELDPEAKTAKDAVWQRYIAFTMDRSLAFAYSDPTMFARDLEVAAQYRVTQARSKIDGKQVRCWIGLRLKELETEGDEAGGQAQP